MLFDRHTALFVYNVERMRQEASMIVSVSVGLVLRAAGPTNPNSSSVHLRNRFRLATLMAKNIAVSSSTVRQRLYEENLRAHRPYRGKILTDECREKRLKWAKHHVRSTRQQWRAVLFTDEYRICVDQQD